MIWLQLDMKEMKHWSQGLSWDYIIFMVHSNPLKFYYSMNNVLSIMIIFQV